MKAKNPHNNGDGITTPTFYSHISVEELAEQQGVVPVTDLSKLAGDFWPEDESSEEFIWTLRQWRTQVSRDRVENS
jgi:hypothetical protein